MAGKAAAPKDTAPQAGLTPEPEGEDPTRVPDTAPATTTDPVDRSYVVLIGAEPEETAWDELGTVTAATRPEAWEQAKAKWPQLVPPTPASPEDAQKQKPVLAKVVPARNFITIESTVEYVAPRAVAKGI